MGMLPEVAGWREEPTVEQRADLDVPDPQRSLASLALEKASPKAGS
jgi:hypothetical protein